MRTWSTIHVGLAWNNPEGARSKRLFTSDVVRRKEMAHGSMCPSPGSQCDLGSVRGKTQPRRGVRERDDLDKTRAFSCDPVVVEGALSPGEERSRPLQRPRQPPMHQYVITRTTVMFTTNGGVC